MFKNEEDGSVSEFGSSLGLLRKAQALYVEAGERKTAGDMACVLDMVAVAMDMEAVNEFVRQRGCDAPEEVCAKLTVSAAVPGIGSPKQVTVVLDTDAGAEKEKEEGGDGSAGVVVSSASALGVCAAGRPVYAKLSGLKASGLRKWSSTAAQSVEAMERCFALAAHLARLEALLSKGEQAGQAHYAAGTGHFSALPPEVASAAEAHLASAKELVAPTC